MARGRKLRSREPRHPPRPTILLVVDEILIRLVLAEHLESCGFTVINASNGLEAIRLCWSRIVRSNWYSATCGNLVLWTA